MSGHCECFNGIIMKIIPKFSLLLLIWSSAGKTLPSEESMLESSIYFIMYYLQLMSWCCLKCMDISIWLGCHFFTRETTLSD